MCVYVCVLWKRPEGWGDASFLFSSLRGCGFLSEKDCLLSLEIRVVYRKSQLISRGKRKVRRYQVSDLLPQPDPAGVCVLV